MPKTEIDYSNTIIYKMTNQISQPNYLNINVYIFYPKMNICITQIQKAECFATLFQHIKSFTESINIMFEKDRMYVQTMDGAHVSIIEIILPAGWFDVYEHKTPSTVTIGVNATILFKILNSREKTQQINIVYNEETNGDILFIHFTSENKEEFDKHFEIPLIDIDADIMAIPAINHQAEFTLSSYHFSAVINQLSMFGDTLEIECSEEQIMMSSHSIEQGKMSVEIKIDDISSYIIDENGKLNISYSLNYLHNICLYNKISKEIEIKVSPNYPVQIIYDLGAVVGGENAQIKFYLAPKIEDE